MRAELNTAPLFLNNHQLYTHQIATILFAVDQKERWDAPQKSFVGTTHNNDGFQTGE
jgi:hypothetical protein